MHNYVHRTHFYALLLGAVLVLAGCSSSDSNSTGSVSVQSKSGTYDVTGTWAGCRGAEYDVYNYSGTTYTVKMWNNPGTNCSSLAATPDNTIVASVAPDGLKTVYFSADSATADSTPPTGLTQPVVASKLLGTVTSTTAPSIIAVGAPVRMLAYVDDSQTPPVYYSDAGNNGTDGYPDLLQSADTLVKQ